MLSILMRVAFRPLEIETYMKQTTADTYYGTWMGASDKELVESVLRGEGASFQALVERYEKLVFNVVYHYMGSREEVEDLAQEVFLRVYRSLSKYDPDRPLKAWICRITANACLDELRKRKIRKTQLFSDLGEDEAGGETFLDRFSSGTVLTEFEAERVFAWLHGLMDELPEKDKMAFVLREMEGLGYSEIASALETTELAVRIRVSRSRNKLLKSLRGKIATVQR